MISVSVDITKALAKLRDFPSNQLPFAVASALTTTAQQTSNLLTNKLPEFFDRPTPYTMRAIGIERATKAKLQARVFVKPDQLKYLVFGIEGGTRVAQKGAMPLPIDQPRNQYGNLARNKVKQLLARKDVFSGKVNGVDGIWQRSSRGHLRLLIRYVSKATFRKQYPFYQLGADTAKAAFPGNFKASMANAIRTAR
jgi:hypothetical protein